MKTVRLISLALRFHWDAHRSNKANLIAGTFGMLVNNVIVLWGLWAMLFDGKPQGQALTVYFLSLNALVSISWGAVSFLLGGLRSLAEYIEEGTLEPMLATPRHPLLLVGISQSLTPALGDVLQGGCNLIALFFIATPGLAVRCAALTVVSAVAFAALFILAGSVPFFVRRGSALAQLLVETNLSLSFYPTGKMFTERGRLFLYVIPAAATGVLPATAVERGTWSAGIWAAAMAMLFFGVSLKVFGLGLRRYQSASYVMARS
ncbi:MAG TPA: ABC-2 family transporter protein [Myxococcaceae bacterium]|nr:ABC-2 family transporter protein [Myxococcaceae bacterium]